MHLYKKKKGIPALGAVCMVAIFLIVLIYFYSQISTMSREMDESDSEMLKNALENAIITCYAIEGAYPESIEYIEEHYGIVIDEEKYLVDYQVIGANIKPGLTVYKRNAE